MKIGLIVPGFSADEGDWCIPALLDLVRELSRRHRVHVFALRYPHRRDSYVVHGAVVHSLGGGLASGLRRLPLLTAALAGVLAEGRRERFSVLHGIWADEPGFLATLAGRLLHVPSVVSVAGGELVGLRDIGYGGQLSRANRVLTGWALQAADRATAGSCLMGESLTAQGVRRLSLVPLGVDTRRFHPIGGPEKAGGAGAGRLVHVASLSPVKDQPTLLRALALVAKEHPDVTLDVVGEGPLGSHLQVRAGELGVAQRVRFHGALPHDRLPAIYRAADLCLLTSRHESQNLAALEAAACGTPAVGTTVGVMPELAPADCLVAPGDAEALAGVVLRLLENDAGRQRLAESQLALVRREFALDVTVDRLLALYQEVRG